MHLTAALLKPNLVLSLVLSASIAMAQERRESCVIDGTEFSLASGLKLRKIAGEDLIKWPIVGDFDQHGRLVVAESGGVGWPIVEHNQKKLHRIVRLIDSDGDGSYDERLVAADDLAFPEGVLCLGDDLLVSAPPVIWRLVDRDGDGICEDRTVWFDGTTVTNCANDLHGPYLGRDGWIYWCKGAFGEQTHDLLDGRKLTSLAAHIYRSPPDGSGIEPLISGGMDNPVEVAMTPEGEKFFTSTFLQHPSGPLRDGIAHAVNGGLHGKDHRVIEGHIRTGDLMPIMTQLGPAAPSGLIHLESMRLIESLDTPQSTRVLCAALFNLHKVTAHALRPVGSSFRTDDFDLLVTDRIDFHPTDVIEDADGSLIVLDTGGWYDLCCPTSRVDQKTASGGIYRLSSDSTRNVQLDSESVDLKPLTLPQAMKHRHDPRPWVRRRANSHLVGLGQAALDPLTAELEDPQLSIDQRLATLWLISRIATPEALETVSHHLNSDEPSMVQASCHVVGLHRDSRFEPDVTKQLGHDSAQVRRAAAEALGRIGGPDSILPLLQALDDGSIDRHLEHSLLFALIEINRRNPDVDWPPSRSNSPSALRAQILTLQQLGRGEELSPSIVLTAALGSDEELARDALTALASHPEWASSLMDSIEELWKREDLDHHQTVLLSRLLAAWKQQGSVKSAVGDWLRSAPQLPPAKQAFLASSLDKFSDHELTAEWTSAVATWLLQCEPSIRNRLAVSLARLNLGNPHHDDLRADLVRLAGKEEDLQARLRLLASAPLAETIQGSDLERATVDAFVAGDENAKLAAEVLLRCRLSAAQCSRLVDSLTGLQPQQLMSATEIIRNAGLSDLDQKALAALRDSSIARSLPRGHLTNLYEDSGESTRRLAAEVTKHLETAPENVQEAVRSMLAQLPEGDATRGLQIFRGERAACSNCHRMGYIGQEVGPVLTNIGASRTREALLEAILFPSARLEQSYQSTKVLTVDGTTYNGLIRRDEGDSIELQLNAERTVRIPRADIEAMEPSSISVMPQGMAEVLSRQQLADLLALLQAAR